MAKSNFEYTVRKVIGAIGNDGMELRVVSWNKHPDKYDIRPWYKTKGGEERCKKGISFTESELKELMEILSTIDMSAEVDFEKTDDYLNVIETYGVFQKTNRSETRVQLVSKRGGDPIYDISTFLGDYVAKGISLTKEELEGLMELINGCISGKKTKAPAPAKKKKPKANVTEVKQSSYREDVVHSLTSLPVNDGNYPLDKATEEELRTAIEIMKASPKGNKVRLTRCEAKLNRIIKNGSAVTVEETNESEESETDATNTADVDEKETDVNTEKANKSIIKFPTPDTEEVKKLSPTGENHSYEEAEKKLNDTLAKFNGDKDVEYVINGLLKTCKDDQEFLDNVMRPEKTYEGGFQYLYKKAKEGHCIMIGNNCGIMTAETALKYMIDYFNCDEQKNVKSSAAETTKMTKTSRKRKSNTAEKVNKESSKVTDISKVTKSPSRKRSWRKSTRSTKKGGRK